ncbi:MAG: hypothetical protein IPL61_00415 [Myxococcales bacterium]|nr:hypothetical protein [Myxococcales bacterium]
MAYRDDPPELAAPRRGAHLPLLDRVTVATPCAEPWAAMVGDARVRHCRVCDQQVFNTLAMTTAEVEALLARVVEGGRACGRLYRRPDGSVITADCVDARGVRRALARRLAGVGAAVAAGVAGLVVAWPAARESDRGAAPAPASIGRPVPIALLPLPPAEPLAPSVRARAAQLEAIAASSVSGVLRATPDGAAFADPDLGVGGLAARAADD